MQDLQNLQNYLTDFDYVAFDTETTGVDKGATVIGFSVAAEVDLGFYVITDYWDVEKQSLVSLETRQGAKAFMDALVGKSLLMHNAGFDCARVFENWGVELMPSVHTDTMLLGHLLNENRANGLKDRGVELFGEDVRKEQEEMKASVHKNGGVLTKKLYELYKADADLIARYGAMDAILTLKLFYNDVPILLEERLDKFFYEEETMPLCRLAAYEMNTTGLRVDNDRLQKLKKDLEVEILEAQGFIYKEITPTVSDLWPGTSKKTTFNIGSNQQMTWLLFERLGNEFNVLTKSGRDLCKALKINTPYYASAKREFIETISTMKGEMWQPSGYNAKTKKAKALAKIKDPWCYMSCGKETITKLSKKYRWCAKLLEYAKAKKLLNTYVLGIEERTKYGIIRPNFLQHGTTSGRFSCKNPNFTNLPRDDKRVKGCIVARPGKVFIGADYSQLEPRVFASVSQDKALMDCFAKGQDFYSVVGTPVYGKDCSLFKKDENSFASLFPELRNIIKQFALATPYGTSAFQQSMKLGLSADECQRIINDYFSAYPSVETMMLESHAQAKADGVVYSLFGRPRRIPEAKKIDKTYGKNTPHSELPYAARTLLNLAMNHKCQSSAASIINRSMVALCAKIKEKGLPCALVLMVHDSLVVECEEKYADQVCGLIKECMENTVSLPGVRLEAEPKIGKSLAEV